MMRVSAALALAFLATPACAQSTTDPRETVRAFYVQDSMDAVGFYAKHLRALYERDKREAKGEVGRLGFVFYVNGQDTEANWRKTLKITAVASDDRRAEVQATFRNGTLQDLRYDLVRENGRWLIADVRALRTDPWDLVTILSAKLP